MRAIFLGDRAVGIGIYFLLSLIVLSGLSVHSVFADAVLSEAGGMVVDRVSEKSREAELLYIEQLYRDGLEHQDRSAEAEKARILKDHELQYERNRDTWQDQRQRDDITKAYLKRERLRKTQQREIWRRSSE